MSQKYPTNDEGGACGCGVIIIVFTGGYIF